MSEHGKIKAPALSAPARGRPWRLRGTLCRDSESKNWTVKCENGQGISNHLENCVSRGSRCFLRLVHSNWRLLTCPGPIVSERHCEEECIWNHSMCTPSTLDKYNKNSHIVQKYYCGHWLSEVSLYTDDSPPEEEPKTSSEMIEILTRNRTLKV